MSHTLTQADIIRLRDSVSRNTGMTYFDDHIVTISHQHLLDMTKEIDSLRWYHRNMKKAQLVRERLLEIPYDCERFIRAQKVMVFYRDRASRYI